MMTLFINYKSLSDERLMELVRLKADERAFDELYRRYARLLQGFFFRRLGGDAEQASDLLQDTFLRVWQALTSHSDSGLTSHSTGGLTSHSTGGPTSRSWLFTIAYNLCKNIYRSNQHEQAYLDSLPADEPAEEAATPLQLDAAAFDQALQQELSRLPEPQQMLFELRFTQELTVPEIAAIIGIPEGTVKSRLHTLTNYLRLKLKDYE
ncbi:MAG: sigma-70 family RNA polymerase sigma factor [Paludibacteraceae bacterium]|nr:sigma-70 family RNA polymerase sigma factor [Paludibacteraceae bacterium]